MEPTRGRWGAPLSHHLFTQEKAGCQKDALMPFATISIWSFGGKVYMVSVGQNLSFRGVGNVQFNYRSDQFLLHDLNSGKPKETVLSFQTLFLN